MSENTRKPVIDSFLAIWGSIQVSIPVSLSDHFRGLVFSEIGLEFNGPGKPKAKEMYSYFRSPGFVSHESTASAFEELMNEKDVPFPQKL